MVAGHSFGEYVALCVAGVLGEEDLIGLSEARGRFIVEAAGSEPGTMAAIQSGIETVSEALEDREGIWIANVNAPNQIVISGTQSVVEEAVKKFESSGIQARLIPVACAFHSPIVSQASKRLRKFLSDIELGVPYLTVYSNTTASPYPPDPKAIARQLVQHLISQVEFVLEIEAMYEDGARIFVEVGPGRVLSGLVDQILCGRPHLAVTSNHAGRSGLVQLQHLLGQLTVQGIPVKMDRIYEGRALKEIDLKALYSAKPHQAALSPTTWLVNGTRAKSFKEVSEFDPTKPITPAQLTVTEETTAPASVEPKEARISASKAQGEPRTDILTDPAKASSSEATFSAGPSLSGDGRSQVMLQFQRLMQRFLEIQKSVTTSYFRGTTDEIELAATEIDETLRNLTFPTPSSPAGFQVSSPPEQHQIKSQEPFSEQTPIEAPVTSEISAQAAASPSLSGEALLSREELTLQLRQIVSERTGYPQEMLDLDLDLEADLGIDSIKRVEILGNFLSLISTPGKAGSLGEAENLGGKKTLREIIDWMEKHKGSADKNGEPGEITHSPLKPTWKTLRGHTKEEIPPRFTLTAVTTPLGNRTARLAPNRVLMVTDDGRGIAQSLTEKLESQGYEVAVVKSGKTFEKMGQHCYGLKDGSTEVIGKLVETVRKRQGSIGSLIHLLPLKEWTSYEDVDLAGWQERLQLEVKTLFHLLKFLEEDLKGAAAEGGACVVSTTGMGGSYVSEASANKREFFPGQGSIPGLLKTVDVEWPEVRVKAVDLNLDEPVSTLADHLVSEIETDDDIVEVGYDGDRRLRLSLTYNPVDNREETILEIDSSWVILVTGGARGITAEVTRELARRHRPTLILAGRSPLPPEEESEETARLALPQELKAALIAKMQRKGEPFALTEVEAAYQRLCKEREIRSNLAAMREAGAKVEYFQLDVRDERAFGRLIDDIYRVHSRLDGVIHGAGSIEDKLLKDKTWESFDRVFGTKTESAFILSRKLCAETLKFLVLFSSVAGRFGNRGQCDYTAANEVLNKLAVYLDKRWPARVLALNWGPWEGAGMVSAEVRRQFAERGVGLVPPSAGAAIFDREIHRGQKGEAEIVIGDGPWGEESLATAPVVEAENSLPLLQNITPFKKTNGLLEIAKRLDPAQDLYLRDHRLDFKPVFPAAMAIELMAEVAQMAWPELKVAAIKDVRVFKGIVLDDNYRDIRISASSEGYIGPHPESIELNVTMNDIELPEITFYKAAVVLKQNLPQPHPEQYKLPTNHGMKAFATSVEEAYRRLLFHGPRFQCIQSIDGISEQGMLVTLLPSSPGNCVANEPLGHWLIDPIVMDSGPQLALLWARTYFDITPLPSRFQEVHIFKPFHSSSLIRCYFQVLRESVKQRVYANVFYTDQEGCPIGMIKGLESTGTKSLNRLAGSHLLQGNMS
jgi:malonyl CoA-acyl carrier protein transacylase